MIEHHSTHVVLAGVPSALVHRFFLTPHHIFQIGIRRNDALKPITWKWIQLFETHYGNVVDLLFATGFQQVVVDLAATQHHAPRFCRINIVFFAEHVVETPIGEVFECRHGKLVPQQTLWRQRDKWLACGARLLPTQHMVNLGRC